MRAAIMDIQSEEKHEKKLEEAEETLTVPRAEASDSQSAQKEEAKIDSEVQKPEHRGEIAAAKKHGKENIPASTASSASAGSNKTVFKTKKFTWFNPLKESHTTSRIIIQNENGPCALLAIANTLIMNHELGYTDTETEQFVNFVEQSSKVKMTEIVDHLGLILLGRSSEFDSKGKSKASSDEAPESLDISKVFDLLPRLHKGLNINPNFVTGLISNSVRDLDFSILELVNYLQQDTAISEEAETAPESASNAKSVKEPASSATVESISSDADDAEVSLFKSLGLSIYHGWKIDPLLDVEEYHTIKYLETFDRCQNFLIFVDEIEANNTFSEEQVAVLKKGATHVANWISKSSTQLTEAGIASLKESIEENKFVIFFRNDHFATMFKRKVSDEFGDVDYEIYNLVTDVGFQRYNVVWQELKTVNGEETLYDMNFLPVKIVETRNTDDPADFKLAKSLQEKEDAYVAKKLQKSYIRGGLENTAGGGRVVNKDVTKQVNEIVSKEKKKEKERTDKKIKQNCIVM